MNLSVFLKVFADINLYFACVGALPALFPYHFHFLWPALVCGACTGISACLSNHGKGKARYPFLLLAALPLLLGNGILELFILLPPVAYAVVTIVKDQWSMEYFEFRDSFRRTLIILGISVVLIHFGVLIENRSDRTHVLSSVGMLRHVLIYAVCGIILQRNLRLGADDSENRYLNGLQLTLLAAGTGIIVLSIVLAEWYLSRQGISLGQILGYLLQMLFGIFLSAFQYLFTAVAEMVETAQKLRYQDPTNTDVDPIPVMPMEEMQQMVSQASQEEAAFPWWLALLLLALFTCILILLHKTLGKHTTKPTPTETIVRIAPKPREPQQNRSSNRNRLRKIYRDFLKTEKRRGHKLLPYHTSRDILSDMKSGGNSKAAAKLRKIYLSARYDLIAPVTSQQIQEAREAFQQYKNE